MFKHLNINFIVLLSGYWIIMTFSTHSLSCNPRYATGINYHLIINKKAETKIFI